MLELKSQDRWLVTFYSQNTMCAILVIQPDSCFAEFNHMDLFSSLLICLSLFGILFFHMNWLFYHVHLFVTFYCPYFYASCRVGWSAWLGDHCKMHYADWYTSGMMGAYVNVFSHVELSSKQGADGCHVYGPVHTMDTTIYIKSECHSTVHTNFFEQAGCWWLPCLWSCPHNGYNNLHKKWMSLHSPHKYFWAMCVLFMYCWMNSSHEVWLFYFFQPISAHRALFMDPQISLFNNFFIKNRSQVLFTHLKIILLQYFSVFSFSFQLYPNGP